MITTDAPSETTRPYSTRLRTALVLTGTGTAGAYHAGVLRALHEAGLRVDIVAGRGIGAVAALFSAVDGGQRLWDPAGLWKQGRLAKAYAWRQPLRVAGWALVAAAALLAVPLVVFAFGIVAALVAVLLSLVTLDRASTAVTSAYARGLDALFSPSALPTVVPRLIVLCLVIAAAALAAGVAGEVWRAPARRRTRNASLWRLIGAPCSTRLLLDRTVGELWNLVRGAAAIPPPPRPELGQRYADLLSENLGQPGFRELLVVTHDLDARQDLVFALLSDGFRQRFFARPGGGAGRAAEAIDLAGAGRDHLIDALAGSLAIPIATAPHLVRLAADGPWQGEVHRTCDRAASLRRLLEEVAAAGAEQLIVVSGAAPSARAHDLSTARIDPRGRAAEQLAAFEAADLRDALEPAGVFANVYAIRPGHNPVGPLDFAGVYDERSDRPFAVGELVDRGYEDAYRQFIEPVVAAGADRLAGAAVQS
ncbi:MAG TPA: patatin-like phospholipase family protein [Vicinamibacterales bacterium]